MRNFSRIVGLGFALFAALSFCSSSAFAAANKAPQITSVSSTSGTVGLAFSFVVTCSGTQPITITADAFPAGLSFTSTTNNSATIGGTPTAAGTFTINLTASNGIAPNAAQALQVTIASGGGGGGASSFRYLTTALPDGSTNAVYAATLLTANAGGSVTYAITSGRLPTGISLDSNTGFITGRPTVVETTTPTISANDGTTTITLTTSVKISAAGGGGNAGVNFVNTSLAQGRVGTAYTETITIQNGVGPFVLGAADLPPGLSMNGQTGAISGTPTSAGTFFATFTALDKGESNQVITTLPLVILPAASDFQFTSLIIDNGELGSAYSFTLTTSGAAGPVAYAATGLPAGLTTDAATGVISGTPTTAGSFLLNLSASDGTATISMNRVLVIAPSSTSNFYWDYFGLPAAIVNENYDRQPPILLATKNPAPGGGVTYTATGFPEGITFNTTSGEVSGTPIEVGIYPVTVTATNTAGETITLSFDFAVLPAKGGDVNSVPANLWVKKQSVKKSTTPNKDSWKGDYIYNADRRTGKAFDPATQAFMTSLGSKSISLAANSFTNNNGKFSYKTAKGTVPAATIAIDPHSQSIKLATGSDSFTDTFPNTLTHRLILGNKGYKLDEFFDEKGKFTPALGYRKTAFVVAAAKVTSGKGMGKDSAAFSMLLGDPAFTYTQGSSVLQFRVLQGATVIMDKLFTDLGVGTSAVDSKSGATVFKLKNNKDTATANVLSKFSYDSKSGKLQVALKALDLTALTGNEVHVGVEFTVGDKIYNTSVTIFAPKAGSYSTKMP